MSKPRSSDDDQHASSDPAPDDAEALAARVLASGHPFPLKREVARLTDLLVGSLFPQLADEPAADNEALAARFRAARSALRSVVVPLVGAPRADGVADGLWAALPDVHQLSIADAAAILAGDPAAESLDEVIAAYPGFLAIAVHRLAHAIHRLDVPLVPRLMAELAHSATGIDIHPGATIGRSLCIDHGTGVVIGETAVIGEHVKLYQGVTLGALSVSKEAAGTKRHPTIGDRVVVYANATVLGGDTTIGADSIIGGNVFLTSSVPPRSLVYQTSGYRVRRTQDGFDAADFVI